MKRLKYVSRFSRPLSADEIDRIVEVSGKNNAALDITGVLMTSGGLFFQVIEGPAENVDKVYSAIVADERHVDVLLLGTEEGVEDRLFGKWSMRKIDLNPGADIRNEPLKAMLDAVIHQREIIESLAGALERAVWHELTLVER